MIQGARSADAQEHPAEAGPIGNDWLGQADAAYEQEAVPEPRERSPGTTVFALLLSLAALGWTALSVWTLVGQGASSFAEIVNAAALVSVPLILIGLIWLIFGRTSRRETERFRAAVARMQQETSALETILGIVASRLEENYNRLTGEAAKLMSLGDEASDRLGRVTHYLSKETAALDRKAEQLETAANAARVDIGILLADLPRAEQQARAVAEALKQTGLTALGEAGQLESQLSALVVRGREADEVVGGTAQRLAAHLARIESSTAAAQSQLGNATVSMTNAVDETMSRTAEAVSAARSSLEAQGQGLLAMIEHSRSALEHAGEESARSLAQRLDQLGAQIAGFAAQLEAQDRASQTLTGRLSEELTQIDQRFAALGETGRAHSSELGESLQAVRMRVHELQSEVGAGGENALQLIERASELSTVLHGISGQLRGEIPAALEDVESQAERSRASALALAPIVEAVQIAACDAAAQTSAAEASLVRQQQALDLFLARFRENVTQVEAQLQALSAAAEQADGAAGALVKETGPELVEALLRVREAAAQAAESARKTIAAVIPQAAADLGEAGRQAFRASASALVEEQVAELSMLSERAAETAREASERLTRQMLSLGRAAAAVEAQIEAGRAERDASDREGMSQRVSLLIESLNSTAIDVGKILSNDVPDSEWAAYLKGDRSVFTRRAVRLLDNAQVRELGHYYDSDAEFREQVNRYIHDFETILRRVSSDREATALGVTLLSSDMGKLYVALAQAIERLRV